MKLTPDSVTELTLIKRQLDYIQDSIRIEVERGHTSRDEMVHLRAELWEAYGHLKFVLQKHLGISKSDDGFIRAITKEEK